jgi:chaperonin GroES
VVNDDPSARVGTEHDEPLTDIGSTSEEGPTRDPVADQIGPPPPPAAETVTDERRREERAAPARDAPRGARERTARSVAVMGDRILVSLPVDAERRTTTGILIPATAQSIDRKGVWGEVIATGPNVRQIATGDEVLYLPDDAIEVDIKGDPYLIVRERDIHASASARRDGTTGLYL